MCGNLLHAVEQGSPSIPLAFIAPRTTPEQPGQAAPRAHRNSGLPEAPLTNYSSTISASDAMHRLRRAMGNLTTQLVGLLQQPAGMIAVPLQPGDRGLCGGGAGRGEGGGGLPSLRVGAGVRHPLPVAGSGRLVCKERGKAKPDSPTTNPANIGLRLSSAVRAALALRSEPWRSRG